MATAAHAAVETPTPRPSSAPDTVRSTLRFIRPQETKPVFHSSALTGGPPKYFFDSEDHDVAIRDMREIADTLSLDREGFVLRRHQTAVADLYDDDAITNQYYPELEAYLRRELGASRVVIFDSTRRSDSADGAPNPDGPRGPAARLHVDYTVKSGPQRIHDFFGEAEGTQLLESGARIVQVNVWRPIRGPVQRAPLALADASSIRREHLLATDQIFPDRTGEIYLVAHDPEQRWYYAPRMTPDEILLIKGWDSLDDGRARFTPHSAFDLPDAPASAPPRESIETRTLVVID